MNAEHSRLEDDQVKSLYRKHIRAYKRGDASALRKAARCRQTLQQREQFRRWLSWNHSRLPY